MKTLLVLGTHFIDENIISEFRKMKSTPNADAILAINNTECKIEFKSRVENRIFFDTSVKCFFFDSSLNDELQLPHFNFFGAKKFEKVMYANGDYRFYYIRKFFPDYDYYWLIEYDVFCNAENYEGFLDKFADNPADLLIQSFGKGNKRSADYFQGMDWIYNDMEKVYAGLFSVVRLSARAVNFLYKRRLEHKEFFQNSTDKNKLWIVCEAFVATELINGGFICENLNEERVKFLPYVYLNDERIFLKPDNHLYHPVKSVKSEISKILNQYADLFFCFRKVFLTSLVENLISNCAVNLKDFPIKFDENFNSVIIDMSGKMGEGGGLSCEVWFITDKIYNSAAQLYSAIVFKGEYLKYFKILEQYIDFRKMHSVQILENSTCKMVAYHTEKFDNVSQVANVTKLLIEMIFTILREKIL